jgi:hypothetical protein
MNHYLKGYVIMPNHFHAIIGFSKAEKSIHTIVSNGKGFIAYELVKRLQEQDNKEVLFGLAEAVIQSDKARGKMHQVFGRSFNWKEITSQHSLLQKLSYIHNNLWRGEWNLVSSAVDW